MELVGGKSEERRGQTVGEKVERASDGSSYGEDGRQGRAGPLAQVTGTRKERHACGWRVVQTPSLEVAFRKSWNQVWQWS